MVTIADVAAHAGVGAGTVSRVLNESPRVSPATRERVLAAIDELEYRPNPLARALSRGRPHTLGAIVPFFTHASAVERLRGVVAALEGSPYDLVLFNVESPRHRDEHLASLTRRDRADGLLVLSLPLPARPLARITAAGVPVVLIDARGRGVPMVVTDDVEGGRVATRHLVELGHERIAFIGDDPANPLRFTASPERERGYRDVLAEAGLAGRPELVHYGPHDRQVAAGLTRRLLGGRWPPTAVFASSDVQALGVIESARAAGLDVPGDLSVIGFDDIEIAAYVGLTTVRQPLYESGRRGTELLLEALGRDRPARAQVHRLDLELVVRSTTAPPPARAVRRPRAGRSITTGSR
jgi:DNA-binding LacI/PurR family transcriptional regulator